MTKARCRWIAGAMTGTSLDGLDAALVRVEGTGLAMRAALVGHVSVSLDDVRDRLLALASGRAQQPATIAATARRLGELHSQAIAQLLEAHLPAKAVLDFVAAHGQTIGHWPGEGLSWQLLDPWPIARQHDTAVVYDFRQADLIAGGQGAPITPIADWVLFRDRAQAVVNLGGICNMTAWSAHESETANARDDEKVDALIGRDVVVCNLLLDGLVQRLMPGRRFDDHGALAQRGRARPALVKTIDQAIDSAQHDTRTLGREQFDEAFFRRLLHAMPGEASINDVLAAAARAVAQRIGAALGAVQARRVIVAGGGASNAALMQAIEQAATDCEIIQAEAVDVPGEAREPAAMAVLGALSQDGVAITRESITGARRPGVAGVWVNRARADR